MPVLSRLAGVVRRFAIPGGVVRERRSGATEDADGNATPGALASTPLSPAVVHRATGKDLLVLPEGDRARGAILVFTLTEDELRTATESTGLEADVVLFQTKRYRVMTSEDWTAQSGHWRSLCLREEAA